MARRRAAIPETTEQVEVEITNRIKVGGAWRARGESLLMTTTEAASLVASGFGKYARSDMRAGQNYRRRDMQPE